MRILYKKVELTVCKMYQVDLEENVQRKQKVQNKFMIHECYHGAWQGPTIGQSSQDQRPSIGAVERLSADDQSITFVIGRCSADCRPMIAQLMAEFTLLRTSDSLLFNLLKF